MFVLPPFSMLKAMWLFWVLAFVIIGGYFSYPLFASDYAITKEVKESLFNGFLLMNVHKFESYWQKEWEYTKTFGEDLYTISGAQRTIYITFVGTFLLMLIPVYCLIFSPTTQALILFMWAGQGFVELHHFAKTIYRGYYYPGTLSGTIFFLYQNSVFLPNVVQALQIRGINYDRFAYSTGMLGVLILYFFLVEEMFMPVHAKLIKRQNNYSFRRSSHQLRSM